MRLAVPASRVVAWSLGAPPDAVLAVGGNRLIHLEGLDDDGAELTLTVHGRQPLPVELRAVDRRAVPAAAVEAVLRRLPPWISATTTAFGSRGARCDETRTGGVGRSG